MHERNAGGWTTNVLRPGPRNGATGLTVAPSRHDHTRLLVPIVHHYVQGGTATVCLADDLEHASAPHVHLARLFVRILLLQAREPDDPMKDAEVRSFALRAGLDPGHFESHDLLAAPPAVAEMLSHDAVMVGGSGDYYVSKRNLPHLDTTLDALRELVAAKHPTFASCFGFQLLVAALGGEIIHDPDGVEVGTYEVRLTEAARSDPLFGTLPERFMAQMGRKDRASSLPDGVVHLVSSERCPYHALRVPGAPIWATQFHPELNREENLQRFRRYIDGYGAPMSAVERERITDNFLESPETEALIPRFLELVFGE